MKMQRTGNLDLQHPVSCLNCEASSKMCHWNIWSDYFKAAFVFTGTGISRNYLIGIMSGRHSLKKGTIMGAVDKIFDNFEMLYGNYTDMPQTREARYNIFRHIEEKGIDMAQMEPYISALIAEYERQGFLYGFRYASALFLDGTLQYGAGSN